MRAIDRIREYRESHGTAYTLKRLSQKAAQQVLGTYDRRWKRERASEEELRHQRENQPDAGLISLVIPVYNTDPGMLQALLDSIRAQTYLNFEAVLYDGASTRSETLKLLEETAGTQADRNALFRVIHGKENKGISGNTNEAVKAAKGLYVALCDHDDLLAPDALWRAAECIAAKHPDVIYSDEDRITENGRRHMDPHYKPDFCPDNLVSDNYICHMAVIRRDLLEETGLRSGFDGSQDHDLFLRLSEKTTRIEHLPHILYSWREVFSSKSHRDLWTCLDNGCRASVEHEGRLGRKAEAVPVNKEIRLWYDIPREATVEAIIHGENEETCRECLGELQFRTDWPQLTGSIVTGGEEERIGMINEAAATSPADYLLILDAGITDMNRYFIREMLMYAQRDDVAGVTGVLTDRKGRITHGGFAVGMEHTAQCINEGMYYRAGGWHDMMNKVHNVSAVSLGCLLVKRENWLPLDEGFRGGLASVDLGLRQRRKGRWYVFTPHAKAELLPGKLLLSGKERNETDIALFRQKWGEDLHDPCYSSRFGKEKANYHY
jgi:GT2 family glycosyltransferase